MCIKTSYMFLTAMYVVFIGCIVKLLDGIKKQVPVGYQNETGFHYGAEKR